MGKIRQHKRKLDEAIICYEEVLNLEPENQEALGGLGDAYAAKKEYEKAIEYYEKTQNSGKIIECYEAIINLNTNIAGPWLGLANEYSKEKQWNTFKKIVEGL